MRHVALALVLALSSFAQNLDFGAREARRVPAWLSRQVIYELWLTAFSPEGTLHGAIPGLARLADLGVGIVYLGPIAKRSGAPHASPYNIADYNAVDRQYGTEQDLRDFTAAAHKLGLKVMLDIVYYHSAPDTVMTSDMLRTAPDGRIVRGFWPQPLPDFKNPRTRTYLIESLVHWVRDFGADGFRCDVAAGVPIDFWDDARKALDRVNPEVILLSEADRFEDQLRAFDINYNFNHYLTLRSVLRDGEPALAIREHWEKVNRTFPRGARMLHYSDNHDWRRAVLEFGDKGAFAAAVLNFTLDGIPFLYNGQEIGDRTALHWTTSAPIPWQGDGIAADRKLAKETLDRFKRLLAARAQHPAFTAGELMILNLSNRKVHVSLDLPVMDYSSVENLLKDGKTYFELYSGRVSAHLAAYEEIVGKRIPLAPLKP